MKPSSTARAVADQIRPIGVIAACHFLSALAVSEISALSGAFVGVWVANALSMALIIRSRAATLPAVGAAALGAFGANAVIGVPPAIDLLYTACNAIQLAVAVLLLGRNDWSARLPEPPDFVRAVAIGAGLAPLSAGVAFGCSGLLIFKLQPPHTLVMWLASNALGFILVFPPAMMASRAGLAKVWREGRSVQLVLTACACAAVAAMAATQVNAPFMLVLLPLLAAAIYMPPFEISLITAATGLSFLCVAMTKAVQGDATTVFQAGFQAPMAIALALPCLASLLMEAIRRRQTRLSASEERFRRAMENAVIGVVLFSLEGRITYTNRTFADMLGYAPAELLGKNPAELSHPQDLEANHDSYRQVTNGEIDACRFEKRYLHRDGTVIWTRLLVSVTRDLGTRAPLYLTAQIENIDAGKRADMVVAEAENRWNFALASAGQGVWDADLVTGETFYSDTWRTMLGYAVGEIGSTTEAWLDLVHPEDRERIRAVDDSHIAGTTDQFEAEYRIRRRDGVYIWVLDRGRALSRDRNGRCLRAIGTYTDITRHKQAEARIAESAAALRREKERLRITLQSIGDAVICTDGADRITFMNPIAEKLTRCRFADSAGVALEEVYAPVDEETGMRIDNVADRRARMTCGYTGRAVLVRRDGSRCSIREVISPIVSETAEAAGRVIVFQDYTDARTLQRELAHAASHDVLTGLMNRAAFMTAMARSLEDARRDDVAAYLLFVDLDRFKSVNDGSGHAAGDALLQRVAVAIGGRGRSGDVAARIGGDEFAVILRGCSTEEAHRKADMLCQAIGAIAFNWNGVEHRIGASIGVAAIDRQAGSADEIVARADQACYRAKAAGRGTVSISDASRNPDDPDLVSAAA